MAFLTPATGQVSTINSIVPLTTIAYNFDSGTAQAGGANTITLRNGASSSDSIYNNQVVEIIAGTAIGQFAVISSYVGATKIATTTADWGIQPDNTSSYVVHRHSGIATTAGHNAITLSTSTSSAVNGFYNEVPIKILSGIGLGQIRKITAYDGTTKIATVTPDWSIKPTNISTYAVYGESGSTSAGAATTITLDANASSSDDFYNGMCVDVYTGTGAGQARIITDYNGTTKVATVPAWTTQPVSSDLYTIFGGDAGRYEDVSQFSQSTNIIAINTGSGEAGVFFSQLSTNSDGTLRRAKFVEVSRLASAAHTLAVVAQFYRFKFVGMGTTLNGAVQTLLHRHKSKALTSYADEIIRDSNDVELTRSIITGRTVGGQYINVQIDGEANLHSAIFSPLSASGSVLQAKETPVFKISFIYGLNSQASEIFLGPGIVIDVTTEGVDDPSGAALVQNITVPAGSLFPSTGDGAYFFLYSATDATQYYVWFDVGNGNDDPAPGGTGLEVNITGANSSSTVGAAMVAVVNANSDFGAIILIGNLARITNAANGVTTSAQPETIPTVTTSAITTADSIMSATNGDGIGDFAVVRTKRTLRYQPGQGSSVHFTAIFDTPAAGSSQFVGPGNISGAFFFCYNGTTSFAILRRQGASIEVRTLTLTAAATGGETVSITLDGVTFPVAVTAGTLAHNAYEIALGDYEAARFRVFAAGNTVVFVSTFENARSFTYSIASTGTADGTFAQTTAGTTRIEEEVSQSNWNADQCNGDGPSGFILNPQRGNVYRIVWQWLGFGVIHYYIENPVTGRWILVHRDRYPGSSIITSVAIPHMQLSWIVSSTTTTTPKTIKGSSGAGFIEGENLRLGPRFSIVNTKTASTDAELVLMAMNSPDTFNGIPNKVGMHLLILSISNDSNKPVSVFFFLNPDLNETAFDYVEEGQTAALIDTTSTTRTNGILIISFTVGANDSEVFDLGASNIVLEKNDILVVSIQRTAGTAVTLTATLSWSEDQ